MIRRTPRALWLVLFVVPLWAAAAGPPPLPKDSLPADLDLASLPVGLSARPEAPADNPLTPAKVRLGRRLFFDPLLSGDRTVSCASCHLPQRGFASPDVVAVGVRGQAGRRNAPSLWNVGYGSGLFWDGRAATLEQQALLPIADPHEMGSSVEEAVRRLRAVPEYVNQFREAFGGEVTAANLAKALASFQRSLVAGDNLVDRFRHGKVAGLSESAKQGLWLFESRGGCWRCHSGSNLTDGRFHNTGVAWGKADLGRYEITGQDSDRGAFKTPTLRNIALTAPYMHDGSMATLEEVVRYYGRGGNPNPHLDSNLRPVPFTEAEVNDLVAFLKALTTVSEGTPAPTHQP